MSQENLTDLYANILVGQTSELGFSWHYNASDPTSVANHYDGYVPVADIEKKVFNWEALQLPVFAELPCDVDSATGMDEHGQPIRRVQVDGYMPIINSRTGKTIGMHSDSYSPHDYLSTLIDGTAQIMQESRGDLGVITAGHIKGGARAWVQVAHSNMETNSETGIKFRSTILGYSTLDGSGATAWNVANTIAVCDNTVSIAKRQNADTRYSRKHTKHSRIDYSAARQALGILDENTDDFNQMITDMSKMTVTDSMLKVFLDQWAPLPDELGKGYTRAENKRDKFMDLYVDSDMCAPWKGTAFGVFQTANTFEHHVAEIRGASRAERNTDAMLTGSLAAKDATAWKYLQVAMAG